MNKHANLEQYGKDVIEKLRNGSLEQFGSYTYYDGQFYEGCRIVTEHEIISYVYDYFKAEADN